VVTKVLALRELKVEYKTYESKTALCHLYDHFLADSRIIRLLPQFLGKAFYKRKKFPIQVNLEAKELSKEIEKGVRTVCLPLKHAGSCATVTVGLASSTQDQLLSNLTSIVRTLETKYPGGWRNVRSLHLLSGTTSLPVYMTLRATEEVGMVRGLKKKSKGLVSDELSTLVGATVTVTPYGGVRVKRTKDPMWTEDDDIQVDAKEIVEEEKEKAKEPEKKEKKTKKRKAEDEDSEDEMEDKEMAYMQKVADEEEEIEKQLEESEVKLENKFKKAKKNEDDDEEEADDGAEAENLLSDGEDSESEDELIMKKPNVEDEDDEDEEATPAKKAKKSKKAGAKTKSPKERPASKKTTKQKKFVDKKKKEKLGKGKK